MLLCCDIYISCDDDEPKAHISVWYIELSFLEFSDISVSRP